MRLTSARLISSNELEVREQWRVSLPTDQDLERVLGLKFPEDDHGDPPEVVGMGREGERILFFLSTIVNLSMGHDESRGMTFDVTDVTEGVIDWVVSAAFKAGRIAQKREDKERVLKVLFP